LLWFFGQALFFGKSHDKEGLLIIQCFGKRKVAQQSVHIFATLRQVGRFAVAIFEHFSLDSLPGQAGFEPLRVLLSNIFHAHPHAANENRWAASHSTYFK
jgi:hypothetical protein